VRSVRKTKVSWRSGWSPRSAGRNVVQGSESSSAQSRFCLKKHSSQVTFFFLDIRPAFLLVVPDEPMVQQDSNICSACFRKWGDLPSGVDEEGAALSDFRPAGSFPGAAARRRRTV
jgi:hypothetical protein